MFRPIMFSMMNSSFMDKTPGGQGYDGINKNTAINFTYYSLVLVIGIPGNVIILLIYGRKKRKTSTDVLIIGQCIVDFVACLWTPAFIVRSCFSSLMTTGLCRFAHLAETSSAFTSLFFTTVISIDRYLAVCRPLRRRLTTRSSIVASVVVVVVGVVINIPGAVFHVARSDSGVAGDDRCISSLSYNSTLMQSIVFVLLFALSLITSSIMYLVIYAFLGKRAKIHAKLVGNEVPIASIQPSKDVKDLVSVETATCSSNVHSNDIPIVENMPTDVTVIETHDRDKSMTNSLSFCAQPTRPLITDSTSKMAHPAFSGISHVDPAAPNNAHCSTNPSQPSMPPTQPTLLQRLCCRCHRTDHPRASKSKESDMGRKTTRMLLVITVYFFVTWLPQIVYSVLSIKVLLAISHSRGLDTTFDILTALRLTNHIVNVFVYSLVNDSFRSSLRQMFSCRKK